MPPPRSSERQPYRSRDYSDSVSSSRYLPQQSFPSQRDNHTRPPRTPPLPSSRRSDYSSRRYDSRARREDPPRRSDYSRDSNPFRRVDRPRTSARRLPERDYSDDRRGSRNYWLPPVRNPARYISSAERRESRSSKTRELTPIPAARRDSFRRSRSPIRRDYTSPARNGDDRNALPHREGPRTPPLEHEPASDHSHDQDLLEEEHEIFNIVRRMFKYCYQEDPTTQNSRFDWLKRRMFTVQAEIEDLTDQGFEANDLELIDSTDRQNLANDVERDLNGEVELDYNEEPDSSYRQNHQYDDFVIKSPPLEEL
ncbi:hypothetical protein M3Y97_00707400 [Aphelenchoides bicaudatus]|nr:hypothetical protein M3Y97_00707400 [Aphelenchoides bicaudatus]